MRFKSPILIFLASAILMGLAVGCGGGSPSSSSTGIPPTQVNASKTPIHELIQADGTRIFVHRYTLYFYNPDGTLKTKKDFTDLVSNPVLEADGTIVVSSGQIVFFLNPDGTPKAKYKADANVSDPNIGKDGSVLAADSAGRVYFLNPNGSLKSKSYFDAGGSRAFTPVATPDGTVAVAWAGSQHLLLVNTDGTVKAKVDTGGGIESNPIVEDNGTLVIVSNVLSFNYDKAQIFFIKSDGTIKVKYEVERESIKHTPQFEADGTIVVSSYGGFVYFFRPDGTLKSKFDAGVAASDIAIASNGTIVVSASDDFKMNNHVYFINSDGTLKSKCPIRTDASDDTGLFPPVLEADGTAVVGSWGGHIYVIGMDGSLKNDYYTKSYTGLVFQGLPFVEPDGTIVVNAGNAIHYLNPNGTLKAQSLH